jgi:glycosyltransferase involved in cell wall biosynthesis
MAVRIVNQYFPPDTSATANVFADLAMACQDAGHRVSVLCGRPSYRPSDHSFPVSETRDIAVERVRSTALPLTSIPARLLNYLSFVVLAGVRGLTRARPDVVICGSDPPIAVLVAFLTARGRPTVYFLQDLHPEAAMSAGWISPGRIAATWDWLHTWALRHCTAVICLGEEVRQKLELKGVAPERIVVVPNGARAPHPLVDTSLVTRLRGDATFTVIHAGNLGVAGAWDTIREAQRLAGGSVEFVCVGGGAREAELRSWGLRVEPFESDVAAVMAAGDVQLVTQRSEMEGLLVPSKLYTALVHGRPILGVVPETSEVASTVRRYGCGLVADPDDPEDVAEKVRALAADPARLREMADRARTAGKHYQRPDVFKPLVELIDTGLVKRSAYTSIPFAGERP